MQVSTNSSFKSFPLKSHLSICYQEKKQLPTSHLSSQKARSARTAQPFKILQYHYRAVHESNSASTTRTPRYHFLPNFTRTRYIKTTRLRRTRLIRKEVLDQQVQIAAHVHPSPYLQQLQTISLLLQSALHPPTALLQLPHRDS